MRPEQILPSCFMVQYFVAAVVYFATGEPWRGWYWIFALGITGVVTFKP